MDKTPEVFLAQSSLDAAILLGPEVFSRPVEF